MRRFTVCAPDCPESYRLAWEDAGFRLVEPATWPGEGPDVLLLHHTGENTAENRPIAKKMLPKLFAIIGDSPYNPEDEELACIFEYHRLAGKGVFFTLGSRLPGQPAAPLWDSYRFGGTLPPEVQVKAVADSVYRFLLEDLFRETAEWCGHMSSVVGPG